MMIPTVMTADILKTDIYRRMGPIVNERTVMKGTLMKINSLHKWVAGLMGVLLFCSLPFPSIMRGGEYKYDNYVWLSADQDLQEKDFTDICFINEWEADWDAIQQKAILSEP